MDPIRVISHQHRTVKEIHYKIYNDVTTLTVLKPLAVGEWESITIHLLYRVMNPNTNSLHFHQIPITTLPEASNSSVPILTGAIANQKKDQYMFTKVNNQNPGTENRKTKK